MRRDASSPEAYRADVSGVQSEMLEAIRALIFEVYPKVEEGIEYGMLDYPGLANLAAQKGYVSLYVAPAVLAKHKDAFAKVNSGKSCLRFKKPSQLEPAALKRLLRDVRKFRRQ